MHVWIILLHVPVYNIFCSSVVFVLTQVVFIFSGENVEDAFLDTAKKIYQNIQDGRCA